MQENKLMGFVFMFSHNRQTPSRRGQKKAVMQLERSQLRLLELPLECDRKGLRWHIPWPELDTVPGTWDSGRLRRARHKQTLWRVFLPYF
jgi:hypothetical protein